MPGAVKRVLCALSHSLAPSHANPLSHTLLQLDPGGGSCVQVWLGSVLPRALAADVSLLALEFPQDLALDTLGNPLRHMHDWGQLMLRGAALDQGGTNVGEEVLPFSTLSCFQMAGKVLQDRTFRRPEPWPAPLTPPSKAGPPPCPALLSLPLAPACWDHIPK